MKRFLLAAVLLVSALFALLPSSAAAQEVPLTKVAEDRAWARGVSLEQQHKAIALLEKGNALLRDSIFTGAADSYREALVAWDHPAIHYNLALVLFYLDQPIELYEHIEAALRLGPGPLGGDAPFEKAKAYRDLVERQLARLRIRCDEPGARVVMDGRTLFVGPGTWNDHVRPGAHSIVVTKPEYFTRELALTLGGGDVVERTIRLYKVSELVKYRRKWPAATPWVVLAGGAGVAMIGGAFHYGARQNFSAYDQTVNDRSGSVPEDELVARRSRGNAFQTAAIGCYVAGGAAMATGIVLLYVNRLQPHQEMPPLDGADRKAASWSIAPMVGGGAGGVEGVFLF